MDDFRICTSKLGCGETKLVSEFRKHPNEPIYYFHICRQCERNQKKLYRLKNKNMTDLEREIVLKEKSDILKRQLKSDSNLLQFDFIKKCLSSKCQKIKPIIFFNKLKTNPDGYQDICIDCTNEKYNNRTFYSADLNISEKKCICCDEFKSIDNFNLSKLSIDGYKNICSNCRDKQNRNIIKQQERLINKSNILKQFFNIYLNTDIIIKKCPKCSQPKIISEFNKNIGGHDGYGHYCKEHINNKDLLDFFSVKIYCNKVLNDAVYNNLINKPKNCSSCNIETNRLDAHHDDYTKPLDVRWLCKKCHASWHSKYKFIEIITDIDADVKDMIFSNKILYLNYFIPYKTEVIKSVVFIVERT